MKQDFSDFLLLATLVAEEWAYICQAILPKRVSGFSF